MPLAADRCSAPKTASGIAKHRLLKATTLSTPVARATALFAAGKPIAKRTTAAAHVAFAVRDTSNNISAGKAFRMFRYML